MLIQYNGIWVHGWYRYTIILWFLVDQSEAVVEPYRLVVTVFDSWRGSGTAAVVTAALTVGAGAPMGLGLNGGGGGAALMGLGLNGGG